MTSVLSVLDLGSSMANNTTTQAFCLRRNNHQSDMIDLFDKMYREESLVDVTLACDEGTMRAHKMVLAASSVYFKNIFSKFTNPYQYPVVIVKDMPFSDLKAIVEFIYRGEVTVPQDQLTSVLKSAEALKVRGLSEVSKTSKQGRDDGSTRSRKRKKKRRKQSNSQDGQQASVSQQQSTQDVNNDIGSEEDGLSEKHARDSSDDSSEYTDDDDDEQSHKTRITPVSQSTDDRTYNESGSQVEGEIEPTRLLEQSMITGDTQENGNNVPRFPVVSLPNTVQQMGSIVAGHGKHYVKPMMFDEQSGLLPQIAAIPVTLAPNDSNNVTPSTSSQNHTSVSVSCSLVAQPFDTTGLVAIPGPSNITHVQAVRPSHPTSQEKPMKKTSTKAKRTGSASSSSSAVGAVPSSSPAAALRSKAKKSKRSAGRNLKSQRFQCHVCHQGFTAKRNLHRHMQVHSFYRNKFECDACSKTFAWKHTLNVHREKAHNIKM